MLKKIKEKLSLNFIETEKVKDGVSSLIKTSNKYNKKKDLLDESNCKIEEINLKNTYINRNGDWVLLSLATILFSILLVASIMINKNHNEIDNYLVENNLTVEGIHDKALNNFKLSKEGNNSKDIENSFNVYLYENLKKNDESMHDVLKVTKHQLYVLSEKKANRIYSFVALIVVPMIISSMICVLLWMEQVAHLIRKIRYGKKMDEELMIEKQKTNELRLELNEIENEYVRQWECKIGEEVNEIKIDDIYIKDLDIEGINVKEILIRESVKKYSDIKLNKNLSINQNNIKIPFKEIENEIENLFKEAENLFKIKS